MAVVNSSCYPPIADILLERVVVDNKSICVITIPPSPYVHETTRPLEISQGNFDDSERLRFVKTDKTYTACTVFVRRGEDIYPATQIERNTLAEEKLQIMSIAVDEEVARRLMIFLEDRRVLYVRYDDERLRDSIDSVLKIRERLTNDLQKLDYASELANSLREIRTACRNFLDKMQGIEPRNIVYRIYNREFGGKDAIFFEALGELRKTFAMEISTIARKYGIVLERGLASIDREADIALQVKRDFLPRGRKRS